MLRRLETTLVVAIALALEAGAAIGPIATLNIANANIAPDGFTRSAVLAGGDNFQLNVVNSLTDITMDKTTSIHWHGFFQKGTAWADGPAFVTQCPIASGNSFLYNFDVQDQAGTFWYHSHLATQYCDGLRGVFVVYDPDDPHKALYDIDDDHVSPQQGPATNATLINGLGRFPLGPPSPLAVVNVVKGKRYRFRLVSISCDPNFTFSIDGHSLTVIEADGENVEPLVVDSIQIFAAQRYSFVLNANQSIGNYWIRANPNVGTQGFLGGVNSAILRYDSAVVADPTTLGGIPTSPLRETDLHPLTNPAAPGAAAIDGADVNIHLSLGFDPSTFRFLVNGVPFQPPTVPVLLQILSGATSAASLLPSGSIYSLPSNKVIQITIAGGLTSTAFGAPHPFHLHGHTFSVIRSAGSPTYNYANPVRRDVVNTGVLGDEVTIRFVTDNRDRGSFIGKVVTHIDWHLNTGLAVVLVEDAPDIAAANPVPSAWNDLCPIYDSLSSQDKGAIV
ncbi:laccase [Flammula alnicola]|nr:laccase [Flammula alnicola]